MRAQEVLKLTPQGLWCPAGGFHIDPLRPVERAVVTHGHSDHARAGHGAVLGTKETLAIMGARYGEGFAGETQAIAYGDAIAINGVSVKLVPAGHVLGSAQAVIEQNGARVVVSGDYKRRSDPTCAPFELVPCDIFISEATFGLPVFCHPPDRDEIAKLLHSLTVFPERAHLVGAYALGKAQRLIALLRQCGYDRPIYLHGAMQRLCNLYRTFGVDLGALRLVAGTPKAELEGKIVIAPPSTLNEIWSRRLPEPVMSFASGWMRIRARARQHGAELPLIVSDHADWEELTQTVGEIRPQELWVTHGQEDALVHYAGTIGIKARALGVVGYDEEDDPTAETVADAASGTSNG